MYPRLSQSREYQMIICRPFNIGMGGCIMFYWNVCTCGAFSFDLLLGGEGFYSTHALYVDRTLLPQSSQAIHVSSVKKCTDASEFISPGRKHLESFVSLLIFRW